jgi:RimJ/RimL family protein N-acetyltransferase
MPYRVEPVLPPGSLARLSQPLLHVDELLLRPWQSADVPVVLRAYAEPAIQQWHMRTLTPAEAEQWVAQWPHRWQAETGAGWAVTGRDGVVGQISIRSFGLGEGAGEISYWVLPAARGRRVAGRALSVLTDWAFGTLGLHRIEVEHSTRNPASCRVAEWTGYPLEGTRVSAALHADGWHDMHLHARVATRTASA